ncbi:MAG TPA: hypothetical protein V6C95_06430 [Coleofasciculaceae cyanobacterium]
MKITPSPITGIKATELQLQRLGHHPGSEVWIKVNNNQPYRCFVTKDWGLDATQALNKKDANGKPRVYPEDGNKIWEPDGKNYPNGVEHFQHLANQGCQIFVIPNQAIGGIRASDIQRCQHLFAEADDRPIPEQWERLQWFTDVTGLIPCLVIYSGGKSLHFYFALNCAIAPEDWQRLQRKIILIFRSDPQIQNVNREMRLAGVSRKDKQVSVDFVSDHSYDPVEFEQRLDSLGYFPHGITYERWLKARKLLKDKAPDAELIKLLTTPDQEVAPKPEPRPQPQNFEYSGDTVPLEICLTRDDQELIAHGVSSGSVGRNPMGYKLACNAIGTASALNSLGIRHSDNGYQLLEEFCRRCNPPLPDREIQRLWRQAQKTNPKAALTDEQLLKRVSYWQWKQLPPAKKGSRYISSRQELDKTITRDQWEVKHGFGKFLAKFLTSKLTKVFKGFGDRPEPRTRRLQLQVSSDGVIEFQPGERLKTIAKLRSQSPGKRVVILDRSGTGSGKSHDAGMLHPESGCKVMYVASNHRNPTVETVEEMRDLPPRHNGQVIEAGKFTAKGNPYVRNLRKGEEPNSVERTLGNCHQAELFSALRSKGLDPDQEQADGHNAICGKCPALFNCVQSGFLAQRKEAMESPRIRAHPDSLPQPIALSESGGFDYSRAMVFVDEAGTLLSGSRRIQALKNEIAAAWAWYERKAPEAFEALKSFRIALGEILDGLFDKFSHGKNRGVNHETIIENLPSPDSIPNLFELIAQIQEASPQVTDLIVEADSVTGLGGKWRDAGYSVRSQFRREATLETLTNILNAPTNILIYLLKIWAFLKQGAIRCHHGELTVTIQDDRIGAILRSCSCVVLMDATADKNVLAAKLGIDPSEIVEIRQAAPKTDNLKVVNVQMSGMGSNEVSDSCKQRQVNLLNRLLAIHKGKYVKVLALKRDSHLQKDGYWYLESRGSNEFMGCDVLVAFNTPRPNLGDIEDEYRAIFGSLEGFDSYYQHLIASEIVQLIGRPRANLYPDKQITIYIVGTGLDLEFLKEYGVKLQTVEAFQICPEAGTAAQITRWKILEATRLITEQGGKLTQTAIAELAGKSQELISKLAKDFGGWKRFKKLLLALIEPYRDGNNFSGLSEDDRWLAESYLPALLDESPIEQLGQLYCAVRWERFVQILSAATPRTQARVLGLIFQALPQCLPESVISEALLVPI